MLDGLPLRFVTSGPGVEGSSHLFVIRTARRDALREQLERAGIDALCKNALGETVQPDILVPTVLVTHDNVEEMWNRLYPDADPPWAG